MIALTATVSPLAAAGTVVSSVGGGGLSPLADITGAVGNEASIVGNEETEGAAAAAGSRSGPSCPGPGPDPGAGSVLLFYEA